MTGRTFSERDAQARQALEATGLDWALEALATAASQHASATVDIAVVGEFKHGKSSLVNALLNADVCPVDVDLATAIPTRLRYGEDVSARALTAADLADGSRGTAISDDDLDREILGRGSGSPSAPCLVEVAVPRRLLRRVSIVDTPGVGGLESMHSLVTQLTALSVDGVMVVSDAAAALTRPELEFVERVIAACPAVVFVQTKLDLHIAWRAVLETNRRELAQIGVDHCVSVSSMLRRRACRMETSDARPDPDMNEASGFLALVRMMEDVLIGPVVQERRARAAAALADTVQAAIVALESEAQVLADPTSGGDLLAAHEAALERHRALTSSAARWKQQLVDSSTDLAADIEHGLRHRLRAAASEADALIDQVTPVDVWEELAANVERSVNDAIADTFAALAEGSDRIAAEVAATFAAEAEVPPVPRGREVETGEVTRPEFSGSGAVGRGLTALRGGYSGVLMFGMLGTFAGLVVATPVMLAAGAALGTKTARDERKRQVEQARQQARASVRKYIDTVQLEAGKTTRDLLRESQRNQRDYFAALATDLLAESEQTVAATKKALGASEEVRQSRQAGVHGALAQLHEVLDS